MTLEAHGRVFKKYWRSVLGVVLAVIVAALTAMLLATPRYTASTSLFFAVSGGSSAGDLAQGSTYAERQVKSYARVAQAPIVIQPVIDELGLQTDAQTLARDITVSVPANTAIIEIAADADSPEQASRIANGVARQLVTTVSSISATGQGGAAPMKASVIQPGQPDPRPSAPNLPRGLALAALLGIVLGYGQAVLRYALDTRVRSDEDVAKVSTSTVLATVPFERGADQRGSSDALAPLRAEAYRKLRTSMQFLEMGGEKNAIVFTSSILGEGKTTTAINTARTLVTAGERVLLIDADLRRPSVAGYLDLDGEVGLSNVLIGQVTREEMVQTLPDGLDVIVAGQLPPNPSELLGSKAMRQLVSEASREYDTIIFDSPPLLPVTDAAVLSGLASGTVVVVGIGDVRRKQLNAALESLNAVDVDVLGVVLNKVTAADSDPYTYRSSYSGYGSERRAVAPSAGDPKSGVRREKSKPRRLKVGRGNEPRSVTAEPTVDKVQTRMLTRKSA